MTPASAKPDFVELPVALGTAQLGMDYGIANRHGKPALPQAEQIIERAWAKGLRSFDTAQAYGDSETVLGHCLRRKGWNTQAKLISKLDPATNTRDRAEIRRRVLDSLKRLQATTLAGFLLHREELLVEWPQLLGAVLLELKQEGFIESLGVSVYHPEQALQALATPGIDMVQVPANVFDRRMFRAGVFRFAQEKRKTIFVRSIYLQGLALMDPLKLPENMAFARKAVQTFADFCASARVPRQNFAFSYVRHRAPASLPILGAETAAQVDENCSLATNGIEEEMFRCWDECWPDDKEILINPSKWPPRMLPINQPLTPTLPLSDGERENG